MTARLAALVVLAAALEGQAHRAAYLSAHKAWREAYLNLERDLAAGASGVADRVARAVAEADKFGRAKGDFYQSVIADLDEQVKWLESAARPPAADSPLDSAKSHQAALADEVAALGRTVDRFAADRDPGIVRLRQALERERDALQAVANALAERQPALDEARKASDAADGARADLLEKNRELLASFRDGYQQVGREAVAWRTYYQKAAEVARASASAPRVAPPEAKTVVPSPTPARPAPPPTPGLSMNRWIGAWTYPLTNGLFHGPEPEFVDLLIRGESGRLTGSLYARFKLPPGSPGDPVVRFDFAGQPIPARTQRFELETNDGAHGSIELIPGPAINLLEVNFQIEPRPNKIRQANVVLVKK